MFQVMPAGARRPLTVGERAALSPGLAAALDEAGCSPRIVSRTHPASRVAALWRGAAPILARGQVIHWPDAPEDASAAGDEVMAILQHELQHVLDYTSGRLNAAAYLTRPRNWRYDYRLTPSSRWSDFGVEQRASIAEHYWLLEHGRLDLVALALPETPASLADYERVIPWASPAYPLDITAP